MAIEKVLPKHLVEQVDTSIGHGKGSGYDGLRLSNFKRIVPIEKLDGDTATSSGAIVSDSLVDGVVTATVDRLGGSLTTISNPSAGTYDLDIKSGGYVVAITVFGNNTTLNGSNEFVLTIDNSVNSMDRRFSVQVYDANNGALVDQQITGTVHTQAVAANITTLTFPGMNGFGSAGFYIELR